MPRSVRLSRALTVASFLLLAVSGYLPWATVQPDVTMVPSIGSYALGYKLGFVELLFLGVVGGVSVLAHAIPTQKATGGLLCLLGAGYVVLPHHVVAQQARSLPEVFEPTMLGPALASLAGCLAAVSGALLLATSGENGQFT